MTPEQDIRERHVRIAWAGVPDTCAACGTEWPCDAAVLLAALDEARAATREAIDMQLRAVGYAQSALDAAIAREQALAEAAIAWSRAWNVPWDRDVHAGPQVDTSDDLHDAVDRWLVQSDRARSHEEATR